MRTGRLLHAINRQQAARVTLWRQRSEVILSAHTGEKRHCVCVCVCVCVCLSYAAMVIRSGQCQERLESRGHTAESTFKKQLRKHTQVNLF